MRRAILFVLVVSVATRQAHGRVYYLENVDGARGNDAVLEQSSRDLDLAFAAGEPLDENVGSPTRKVSVNESCKVVNESPRGHPRGGEGVIVFSCGNSFRCH